MPLSHGATRQSRQGVGFPSPPPRPPQRLQIRKAVPNSAAPMPAANPPRSCKTEVDRSSHIKQDNPRHNNATDVKRKSSELNDTVNTIPSTTNDTVEQPNEPSTSSSPAEFSHTFPSIFQDPDQSVALPADSVSVDGSICEHACTDDKDDHASSGKQSVPSLETDHDIHFVKGTFHETPTQALKHTRAYNTEQDKGSEGSSLLLKSGRSSRSNSDDSGYIAGAMQDPDPSSVLLGDVSSGAIDDAGVAGSSSDSSQSDCAPTENLASDDESAIRGSETLSHRSEDLMGTGELRGSLSATVRELLRQSGGPQIGEIYPSVIHQDSDHGAASLALAVRSTSPVLYPCRRLRG
jgi:hypothetical protein